MKITSDLKQAIRAVISEQNRIARADEQQRKNKISEWIKKTPRVKRLIERYKSAGEQAEKLAKEVSAIGLRSYDFDVNDPVLLERAGLKLGKFEPIREERIIAQLARATPAEAPAILKEIGINWDDGAQKPANRSTNCMRCLTRPARGGNRPGSGLCKDCYEG
jgi:hypothetical protein